MPLIQRYIVRMPKGEFAGFRRPTTTAVPDEIFDELMSELSGAELKLLLYICRRTFGFKKDDDNISISQMLKGITKKDGEQLDRGVGLSKPTLLRSIKSLTEKRVIIAEHRASAKKGFEATNYRLNFLDPLGKKMNQGGYQNFTKPLVKKLDPQQTVSNTQSDNTVSNGDLIKQLPDLDQPPEKTAYVADYILTHLRDDQSKQFYQLVAAKIPDHVVIKALAEIKADGGATHPPAVFTKRMGDYARQQLSRKGA